MPASETPPNDDVRKRRTHKKSRKGCGNCKLRRVKVRIILKDQSHFEQSIWRSTMLLARSARRPLSFFVQSFLIGTLETISCDETKPRCVKCVSYGVTCSYAPTSAATALSVEVAFKVDLSSSSPAPIRPRTQAQARPRPDPASSPRSVVAPPPPLAQTPFPPRYVPPPLPTTGSMESPDAAYQLTPTDVRLLERFQKRTILSLGTPRSKSIYEKKTLPIAFCHPVVMHTVIAMTHLHDLTLLTPTSPPPQATQTALAYHWYRGVSLLHRKLSAPILPSEHDALWLASAFISVAAFANVASLAAPRDAWPLRKESPSDLDWLKLGDGKKQVWKMTDTLRAPRGVFADAASEIYAHLMKPVEAPIPCASINGDKDEDGKKMNAWSPPLPEGFAELFNLVEDPTHANPYFTAAASLAACWRVSSPAAAADPDSIELVKPFMGFIRSEYNARWKWERT
ncbi:hypothetical protein CSAL01_06009 [Colletotrichum salicis]|uniref:Zn(2)-C6 fungal-type domain-containing protein n=1 Tax=Colletotrichum salicis TaxID=1209931 RepID=A0A135V907_9PEZI|nr:hypothetical protein CSAL01_06009 [Colletotrichum salicis]